MADIFSTPMPYVLITLIIYAIAYFLYGKWMDTKVWQVDPSRPTPAHVYMDGVEFFPVNRYVLYGFQFKSVAALGPIVGPLTAVALFGWLPALIWIVLGNFFIGWVQDYSSMLLSVRNEGRSFGPITYELLGDRPRRLLLSYLLYYFSFISAAFIYVLASTANGFPGAFTATIGTILVGLLVGQLIYKLK
jgi:carbon starvation protein